MVRRLTFYPVLASEWRKMIGCAVIAASSFGIAGLVVGVGLAGPDPNVRVVAIPFVFLGGFAIWETIWTYRHVKRNTSFVDDEEEGRSAFRDDYEGAA